MSSVVDKIPEGWTQSTLGNLAFINPRESIKKGEVKINVPMACIDEFSKKINSYEKKEYKGGTKFRNGDTLMARITPCLENGKTAFVDILKDGEIGFGSTEYIVIREKENLSDKHFLYYLSISPYFREIAIKAMTGTSGRQRVQTDVLVNKLLNLPPLQEQKAIAQVLTAFDDKIENLKAQNQTLETLAQTIFKEWFLPSRQVGGKYQVGDELPEGWRVGKLSEIADFLNGLALQKFPPKEGQETLPVIKIKEIKNGITSQTDKANTELDEKYIIHNGDVLFSWSGSLEVVIWKYGRGALNQHLFKVTSENFPKWFYYFWILNHLNEFRNIAARKATTMGHINRKHLDQAKVIIPNKETFTELNILFNPILEKIIINDSQIQSLAKTRDTLLPKLMSGELRVEGFKK